VCISIKTKTQNRKSFIFPLDKNDKHDQNNQKYQINQNCISKEKHKIEKSLFYSTCTQFINIKRKKTIIATGSEKQTKNLNDQK